MMIIKHEGVRLPGCGAQVGGDLTKVLAAIFQVQFEGANGDGAEVHHADLGFHLRIEQRNRGLGDGAHVGTAQALQQATEILGVQRAAQALAKQYRIAAQGRRDATVSEYVGEIQFAPWLEDTENFGEHAIFLRGKIQNAVGDDDIDAGIGDAAGAEIFDIALDKLDVRSRMAVALGVPCLVAPRDRELLGSHVDTDHSSVLTDQLREQVDVSTGAATQVQHGHALQRRRQRRTAAIEAILDLRVYVFQKQAQGYRHGFGRAAGAGFQVAARLQYFAVVVANAVDGCLIGHVLSSPQIRQLKGE